MQQRNGLPYRSAEELRRDPRLVDEPNRTMVHQPGVGEREMTTLEDALSRLTSRAEGLNKQLRFCLERVSGPMAPQSVSGSRDSYSLEQDSDVSDVKMSHQTSLLDQIKMLMELTERSEFLANSLTRHV